MNEFDNIKIDDIRKSIRTFNNDENVHKLEKYYHSKSLPEILGASRKELAHSNFLAWMLNPNESHVLRDYPLKKFFELLVIYSKEKQLKAYKELYNSIIVSDFELDKIYIETERTISGVGRLDIYIETWIEYEDKKKLVRLIIENKVGTKEHSDQTTKYFNYYENIKKEDEINIYVFLTPMSSLDLMELDEPECSCKDYIQVNYQSIVDFILEPALQKNITDKVRFIIKDYLQSLSQPTLDKGIEEYKQGLIMALGVEERNLLKKFWDKNQKLILASFYAISSDPEQDKDTRDSASNAIEKLSNSGKNTSLCSIKFKGVIEAEKIRKSDIGYSTVMILKEQNLINDNSIGFLKNDKSCSFHLLKSVEEMTEGEMKYRRYRHNEEPELIYDNVGYYVARNWGTNNIGKFIKNIKSKFSDFEYIIHEN